MIGALTGKILEVTLDTILLDVGGVGYRVAVLPSLVAEAQLGQDVRVLTHLHVREDDMSLYGFVEREQLDFFRMLLAVPGVGPKSAMSILRITSVGVLVRAISSGDHGMLTKVSGIGRKTAERIVVELKTRLEREQPGLVAQGGTPHGDVVEALVALGYSSSQARDAVRKLPSSVQSVEEGIKVALQTLGQRVSVQK